MEILLQELTKAFDDISVATTGSEGGDNIPNDSAKNDGGHLGRNNSLNTSITSEDEDEDGGINSVWKGQQRHVFILSESGKPIFSRYVVIDG